MYNLGLESRTLNFMKFKILIVRFMRMVLELRVIRFRIVDEFPARCAEIVQTKNGFTI